MKTAKISLMTVSRQIYRVHSQILSIDNSIKQRDTISMTSSAIMGLPR